MGMFSRSSQQIVRRDQLAALVEQLREHGMHYDRPVAPTRQKARPCFKVEQGGRDWKVVGFLQGRVQSSEPAHWVCATSGGAWVHAAAGWWPTREAATAALDAAIKSVYADEIAAAEATEARRAAARALRDQFAPRLQALEVRRKAVGGWYSLYLEEDGYSLGGPIKAYTEENILADETAIAAAEAKKNKP